MKMSKLAMTIACTTMLAACGGDDSSSKAAEKIQLDATATNNSDQSTSIDVTAQTSELSIRDEHFTGIVGHLGASGLALLDNDTLDQLSLTIESVTVTAMADSDVLSISNEGTLNVAEKSKSGQYQLPYQVCLKSDASLCASGIANVEVVDANVIASAQQFDNVSGAVEHTAFTNLYNHINIAQTAATADDIQLSITAASNEFSVADNGDVSLADDTLAGGYILTYSACEIINPKNCSNSQINVNVNKGRLQLGKVSGLKYVTDSGEGIVDENGEYEYSRGDDIQFMIGDLTIGEKIIAKANLNLFELFPDIFVPTNMLELNQFYENMWNNVFDYRGYNTIGIIYSLDKDKDWSNGITIDAKLHEIDAFSRVKIERNNILSLQYQDALTFAMAEAYKQGAIANVVITESFVAIDNVLKELDITTNLYIESGYIEDYDADGTFDYGWHFTLDERGFKDMEYADDDGDGVDDSYVVTRFNDYGQLLTDDYYSGAYIEGTDNSENLNWSSTNNYNELGLLTDGNFIDHSGEAPKVDIYVNTYNENNLLVERASDYENDGVWDYRYEYQFDEIGNETGYKRYSGDGLPLKGSEVFHYNELNQKIQSDSDYDGDGDIDSYRYYGYDENGNSSYYKNISNGNFSSEYLREYNERGQQIKHTNYNEDGSIRTLITYSYDDRGNKLEKIQYGAGGVGITRRDEYTYNDNNFMLEQKEYNAAGEVIYITTNTYDEIGNRLSFINDRDNDGLFNNKTVYTVDENGLVSGYKRYGDGKDGPDDVLKIEQFKYIKTSFAGIFTIYMMGP